MTSIPDFYATLYLVDGFRHTASSIYHEYFYQVSGVKDFDAVTQFGVTTLFPVVTSSITLHLEDCSLTWELKHYLRPLNFELSSRISASTPDTPHGVSIILAKAGFCNLEEWSMASTSIIEKTSGHFRQALEDNQLEQFAISIRANLPFKE